MSVAEFLNRPLPIAYGKQTLRNRVALAPMAGMTDVPFRKLAWRFGAGHMVSEMVTSKLELWDTGKSRARRVLISEVRPQAVQIAGHDPGTMAESARRLTGEGVEWVDLNFGCPQVNQSPSAAEIAHSAGRHNGLDYRTEFVSVADRELHALATTGPSCWRSPS